MRRISFSSRAVRTLAISALIACAGTLPAVAQTAPDQTAPQAGRMPGMGMEQMVRQRLARLHEQLRITPAQQGAWDQFEQSSMQNAAALDGAFRQRAAQVPTMTAVQNLQSFADLQMQQAQDMQRLVPAFQQLYGALSPEQQQTADELFRSISERGRGGAGRRP